MPSEITMPQLSDTMTDGTLVKWHKKEGDKVKSGEKLADVETDKAIMEMESFESGTLAAIVVAEGQKVAVGGLLAIVATGQENAAEVKKSAGAKAGAARPQPAPAAPKAAEKIPARQPAMASATLEKASSGEIHEPDHVGHGATREPATAVPPIPRSENGNDRILITPLARRMAAEKRIDPRTLHGTGPNGRIVKQDILSYAPPVPAAQIAALRLGSGEKQVIPLTKMRAAIGKALQASKQNIPHFYETIDVDVEELSTLRGRLNEMLEPQKLRLSLGDFISKAVATALLRHPTVNSTFNGTEITRYGDVNLGMAVAVPDGLIVPVLRNIHLMGLKEIRQQTVELIDRARAQRLKQDEMTGGTFTVSNLGTYGIREFSAIINPPQVGILAVAAAEKRAVVHNNQVVARTMLTLTLSADHRIVDGATAAEFLRTLKGLLEEPAMMLV